MAEVFQFNRVRIRSSEPKKVPEILKLPRVNPVGVLELPAGYRTTPRGFPLVLRLVAATILVTFAVVGTITTVATLGAFCLTSHAGSPVSLPAMAAESQN